MAAADRALGVRQAEMLTWLASHPAWSPAVNGVIVGRYMADTMRVIDSLRNRGLVEFTRGTFRVAGPADCSSCGHPADLECACSCCDGTGEDG